MIVKNVRLLLSGETEISQAEFCWKDNCGKIQNRLKFLEEQVTRKKVIHIGYCDHPDIVDFKIKNDIWLHKRISEKAEQCLGIDLNRTAVEYIRAKYGYHGYCLDIIRDELPGTIKSEKWDYVLLPEVLEHLNEPVTFLTQIREKFGDIASHLIITVPNALRLANIENIFYNKEYINSDHRWWFTPYTLSKISGVAGLNIEAVFFVESYNIPRYALIRQFLLRVFPGLRDTIILIAKF